MYAHRYIEPVTFTEAEARHFEAWRILRHFNDEYIAELRKRAKRDLASMKGACVTESEYMVILAREDGNVE